ERMRVAIEHGIVGERIVLDPGFGFGKRLQDNWNLFCHLPTLSALGAPLLVGVSRKSMLRGVVGDAMQGAASIAAAVLAVERGARIVRVHDVAETVAALKLLRAIQVIEGGEL
ncbi:MAG: dihydropteroate synthase, partial [Methylophilaceae bacterium]|nr:dihydropteroate synthase [Methylophilaceae bacterium]